jgi:hypothetical protein
MHGGAKGSGGPKGKRDGNYKNGRYTAEAVARRKSFRESVGELQAIGHKLMDRVRT